MEDTFEIDNMELMYVNENSLSKELCDEMIQLFERSNNRYTGITASGVNSQIKDTTDLVISSNPEWSEISKTLYRELQHNISKYVNKYNNMFDDYTIFHQYELEIPSMQMQKYNKNVGKYVYHNDFRCDFKDSIVRQITFLWYINDVDEGGETEFWSKYNIKPKTGKLVLFPAHWTYPHSAKKPISNDKYVITGWIWERHG
mgnify:FL=1|jgi:hypothetical protein